MSLRGTLFIAFIATTCLLIGTPVFEIDAAMSGIEIAHDDQLTSLPHAFAAVFQKSLIKGQLKGDPVVAAVFAATVGEIDVVKGEILKFGNLQAAFAVKLMHPELGLDRSRMDPAKEPDSAIASAFRRGPEV